jgi:tRNA-2-methylthio-N6-dimethylallyladenosine synthase
MGYKDVTLLGQNVNSYSFEKNGENHFPGLLEITARTVPEMRIRFSTSHPKDISDELLFTIQRNENICRHIHLPFKAAAAGFSD